jgi:broad specificity phosphatase PhoE
MQTLRVWLAFAAQPHIRQPDSSEVELLMAEFQTITLARHGPVDVSWDSRIPGGSFVNFVGGFRAAGIVPTAEPPPAACREAREAHTLICSDLPRAVESMQLIAPGRDYLQEALFREAEVPTPFRTSIPLRAATWAVLARVLWYMRKWPGIESPREAQARAQRAADVLEALAAQEGPVFLLGHGYFNAAIMRQLRRRGWRGPKFPSVRYWSAVTYRRPY